MEDLILETNVRNYECNWILHYKHNGIQQELQFISKYGAENFREILRLENGLKQPVQYTAMRIKQLKLRKNT